MREPRTLLVQYRSGASTATAVGIRFAGVVHRVPDSWPSSLLELITAWDDWAPRLRALDVAGLAPVPDAVLLAPLTYPGKVICAGANYYDHAAEMGTARPDPTAEPFFFLKPPTTTVVGDGAAIVLPDAAGANVDWEIELAVVIGQRCTEVPVAQARRVVAGYSVANDVSARGLFPRPAAVSPAFGWDWVKHKALDTFCPLGPGIVPVWEVEQPHDLALRLSVNGAVKQKSSTAELVVDVDGLIAAASRWMTLEPGDVILTGTPAGVGMPRGDFLKAGDLVVAEIEGIGTLTNPVVSR